MLFAVSEQRFEFDYTLALGAEKGNRAFFGQNVLQGLIDGIEDFAHERQPRLRRDSYRIGAPALLACSPWINDPALLTAIKTLPACVVISKLPRTSGDEVTFGKLRRLNERTPAIPIRALAGLHDMAPKESNGKPPVIGPYEPIIDRDFSLSTFRTIGYRKTGAKGPPIAHAKLALLGNICWTDEDPVDPDYIWFQARRLWVSSANFTFASRRSLEFGYWTEDAELIRVVNGFLIKLIGASEDLDATTDTPDPEFVKVEYDDAAMFEAVEEMRRARAEEAALLGDEEFDDED
jgi:hypothetical protein